jgi:hypothetical protein
MTGVYHEPDVHRNFLYGKVVLEVAVPAPVAYRRLSTLRAIRERSSDGDNALNPVACRSLCSVAAPGKPTWVAEPTGKVTFHLVLMFTREATS